MIERAFQTCSKSQEGATLFDKHKYTAGISPWDPKFFIEVCGK